MQFNVSFCTREYLHLRLKIITQAFNGLGAIMIDLLSENIIVKKLNRFLYSPYYMLTVALLMAASNIFSLEFPVMYIYMLFAVAAVLFSPDCFPVMPMVCCGYMLFSAKNNPVANYGKHFLSTPGNQRQFVFLVVVIAVSLITRFVYEIVKNRHRLSKLPELTTGFLLLGGVYVLSGFLSEYYSLRTVIFGLVQIVSLCVTYFFFAYTIDWTKRQEKDIALMFCAVGVGLFLEIIAMYCTPTVIEAIKSGTFHRRMLLSGWGVYNNVGGMAAMMIPVPFYLAASQKRGSLWILLGGLFLYAVVLTQSRGSIMAGTVVFLLCAVCVLIYSKGTARIWNAAMLLITTVVMVAGALLILETDIANVFESVMEKEFFESEDRFGTYRYGLESFLRNPVFGNGFYFGEKSLYQYGMETLPDGYFLPPRYHNTYIQLLVSGGIFAIAAYLFHRAQTVLLVLRKKSVFKIFLGISVLALLVGSLVDCHFFNFGPGLTYGILLICAEKIETKAEHSNTNTLPRRNHPMGSDV